MTCIRLNSPGGFAAESIAIVECCLRVGGLVVVYGHPHSLQTGNTQGERWLEPFLSRVQSLCARGLLRTGLPRDLDPVA